jgi:hypothetical protein
MAASARVADYLATVAAPERMGGKTIVTIGYLEYRDSGALLYLAEEDARFQIQDNAVKVEVSGEHVPVHGASVTSRGAERPATWA